MHRPVNYDDGQQYEVQDRTDKLKPGLSGVGKPEEDIKHVAQGATTLHDVQPIAYQLQRNIIHDANRLVKPKYRPRLRLPDAAAFGFRESNPAQQTGISCESAKTAKNQPHLRIRRYVQQNKHFCVHRLAHRILQIMKA